MHTDTPFFSRLSPIPSFPPYSGPYSVGTQDVEIPVSELSSPVSAPDPQVSTISFRLFYPCESDKRAKSVYWLPEPQGEYLRAYYRFMQASPWLASLLSYIPLFRLIHYTTIPAVRNAKPIQPPSKNDGRWPVMVFSHGLGGTRNSYSHICGLLASHGLVVLAPEHRDGSAPIAFIRDAADGNRTPVQYTSLPHDPNPEVEDGRDLQLKIRCWELGLVHDALLKLDKGATLTNVQASRSAQDRLTGFQYLLDVHRPGKISWAGHSFGASTIVQFVKSVFYGNSPLYTVPQSSALSEQITPSSPTAFLDLWTLPLLFKSTSSLWAKPLPAYSTTKNSTPTTTPSPPLAITSESFFKWSSNLRNTVRAVSPPVDYISDIKPHLFYPIASAHLSQSDFGLLFPWITKKALKAEEPERTLRLNARAILESLRRSSISVADTSRLDMEIKEDHDSVKVTDSQDGIGLTLGQDQTILDTSSGSVRGWIAIDPHA